MFVKRVPQGYRKDLTSREVNRIETLRTFIVPPKVERLKGREVTHKPIYFYSCKLVHQNLNNDQWEKWAQEVDDDNNNEQVDIDITQYFGKCMSRLANKAKCPKAISKREMERFEKMWSGSIKTFMGLDGTLKRTRGLGENSEDDLPNLEEHCRNSLHCKILALPADTSDCTFWNKDLVFRNHHWTSSYPQLLLLLD